MMRRVIARASLATVVADILVTYSSKLWAVRMSSHVSDLYPVRVLVQILNKVQICVAPLLAILYRRGPFKLPQQTIDPVSDR